MKTQRITTAFVLLSFLLPGLKSEAQFYKDMSIGLNGGAYIYQGDLTPETVGSFKTTQPGFSFFVKKPINNFLAARLHISIAKLQGDDSRYNTPDYRQHRNFYFTTPVKEFSAQLVWNILRKTSDDRGIMPYIFSGAGVSFIGVKKDYSRVDTAVYGESSSLFTNIAIDNAKGTPRSLLSVPIGVGAEYPISDRFSVNVEISYRFIFTDYLDGFSQSANPKQQDHYHSTSAGIIYKFWKKENMGVGCPRL